MTLATAQLYDLTAAQSLNKPGVKIEHINGAKA